MSTKVQRQSLEDTTRVAVTGREQAFIMTPQLTPDYWTYRVALSNGNAIVAAPEFGTLGIRYQIEDEYNVTNRWDYTANEIEALIRRNRPANTTREEAMSAIRKIQGAIRADLRKL